MNSLELFERSRDALRLLRGILRSGRPQRLLASHNGVGDILMFAAVFHELKKRGARGLYAYLPHSHELLWHNPDVDGVLKYGAGLFKRSWGIELQHMTHQGVIYDPAVWAGRSHLITELCHQVGF